MKERLYHHTVDMKASGRGFREDRDAYVLGDELDGLLGGKDIVSVPGGNRFASGCIHNRLIHKWMDPFREQDPFVLCQILQNQTLFVSSRVGFEKSRVEWGPSERHGRDLSVLGRRRHEREVQFAYKDTPERLHGELSYQPEPERRV
jgi:hypothetical protein